MAKPAHPRAGAPELAVDVSAHGHLWLGEPAGRWVYLISPRDIATAVAATV
eukprot:m.396456 g.396456  ORF g.396456 m.396456 type:complete len:51 (+) comp16772_c1_seq31:1894-2046(+)